MGIAARLCLAALLGAALAAAQSPPPPATATCAGILNTANPAATTAWIDPATPAEHCVRAKCVLNYTSCMGSSGWPAPYGGYKGVSPPLEQMVLVFSDEFENPYRDFSPGNDAKWQALDLLYINGDEAVFRQDAVSVRNGKLVITASREKTTGPFTQMWGDVLGSGPYKSGMVQSWNKFCYTGGYLETLVKLPGDHVHGGFWPAVFTLGNLARAGYIRSTEGLWPFSYDVCDKVAVQAIPGSEHIGQKINRCNSTKGRGAPELDLLEVGVWEAGKPMLSTSIQMAPLLPLGLHWMDNEDALLFPTYSDPDLRSGPNGWDGVNSFMRGDKFIPRPGSRLADALSATHYLNASYFTDYYKFGLDWYPQKYIRWYINDILIYEVNAKALKGGTNADGDSVGDRMIPVEPQYLNINLAMSHNFAPIDPHVPLPSEFLVEYVRIYQLRDQISLGCDTPDFPSQDYIEANKDKFRITLPGWDDYIGNSHVMGPTRTTPLPPKSKSGSGSGSGSDGGSNTVIIAAAAGGGGGAVLIGGLLLWWCLRRKRAVEDDSEYGGGGGGYGNNGYNGAQKPMQAQPAKQLPPQMAPQMASVPETSCGLGICMGIKAVFVRCCYGNGAHSRHTTAVRPLPPQHAGGYAQPAKVITMTSPQYGGQQYGGGRQYGKPVSADAVFAMGQPRY